jgi:hypothetical protein
MEYNLVTREATLEELLHHIRTDLHFGWKVRFRHFTKEQSCSRSWRGVRHVRNGRSKVRLIDGVPHVMHNRELVPLTATALSWEGRTKPIITDVRIKSEYLL